MSYQNRPLAGIIASYRAQHLPYTEFKHWRDRLQSLSWDLAEHSGKFWNLDIDLEEYYVYVLMDPRHPGRWTYTLQSGRVVTFPYRPFYVGKGKGNRSKDHGRTSSLKINSPKNNTIKAIRSVGLNEIVEHSRSTSRVSTWLAQAYEIDLIAGVGRADIKQGPLTNLTDGGDGGTGCSPSAETREKLRRSSLGNKRSVGKNLGTPSDETRQRISEAKLGWNPSAETRHRMSEAAKRRIRKPWSAETRARMSEAAKLRWARAS